MIMADDIGWLNVSTCNHGIMGYRTANIDRIAKEGAMLTDWADVGLHAEDVTVAEALKSLGYATTSLIRALASATDSKRT